MKQNIIQNHTKSIDAKLYSANYYDFMLFKGDIYEQSSEEIKDNCIVDFSKLNIVNNILFSDISWKNAINEGVELNNIGLTGVDNGFITYRKDRITNEEFLNLFLNSKLKIKTNDTRLFLSPVTGNTLSYSYPMSLIEDNNDKYLSFKGGFYQGFFKIEGVNYQVLPNKMTNDWFLKFEIRPRSDYKTNIDNINYTHPNNEGIFFFLGTRAENKFWVFYKTNDENIKELKKINAKTEGYFFDGLKNNVIELENNWLVEEKENIKENIEKKYFNSNDEYFLTNTYEVIEKTENYFDDSYMVDNCPEFDNNKIFEEDFIGKGILIDEYNLSDSENHELDKYGYKEIESDNKFILFDRTSSGFTIDNWIEGTKIKLTSRKDWNNANYFLLMDRTETGYTIDNINMYNENNSNYFDLYKDILNNVFCLRITKEGSIGYRYGVIDCEKENKYNLIEEYSKPNIIKYDDWNKIDVRFKLTGNNLMRIMIYVNKNLIFISKEIKSFNFKKLDEVNEKQEGVPYNISLGGGSLGLLETIIPNYYAVSDYILPIERDFCGSFLGDIKTFKMYEGFINIKQ